jgi:hypothetical protein
MANRAYKNMKNMTIISQLAKMKKVTNGLSVGGAGFCLLATQCHPSSRRKEKASKTEKVYGLSDLAFNLN